MPPDSTRATSPAQDGPCRHPDDIAAGVAAVKRVAIAPAVLGYIVDIARATRMSPSLSLGVSPRGATALLATSRAWAWLSGRDFVTPDDVRRWPVDAGAPAGDAPGGRTGGRVRLGRPRRRNQFCTRAALMFVTGRFALPRRTRRHSRGDLAVGVDGGGLGGRRVLRHAVRRRAGRPDDGGRCVPMRRPRPFDSVSTTTQLSVVSSSRQRYRGRLRDAWQPSAGAGADSRDRRPVREPGFTPISPGGGRSCVCRCPAIGTARPPVQPAGPELGAGGRQFFDVGLQPTRRGDRLAIRLTLRRNGPLGLAGRQRSLFLPGAVRALPAFDSRKHLPSRLASLRQLDGRSAVHPWAGHRVRLAARLRGGR